MDYEKAHILFVDDQKNLLQGIKRMLRSMRNTWELSFANSAAEALDIMSKKYFDIIVTDMRMPEMNGVELLNIVIERYPAMIRIILSGYAEDEAILKTVGPSHQYLAKPCDTNTLIKAINDSFNLRTLLANPDLRAFVAGLTTIPSPSRSYQKLVTEIKSSMATTASVAAIISDDIALSVQTLKLTNSAYFSVSTKITSCREAVQLLGFDTILGLATIANFYSEFQDQSNQGLLIETLCKRSLEIGILAQKIAQAEGLSVDECNVAYLSGLLAHVGTLVLIVNFPERFKECIKLTERHKWDISKSEQQVFDATHAALGAYLLGLWGFNDRVINAVANHHAQQTELQNEFNASSAVYFAQFITRHTNMTHLTEGACLAATLNAGHLDKIGWADRMQSWIEIYRKQTKQSEKN